MYGLPSHTLLSTLSREAEKTEEDAWNPLEKVVLEKVTLEKVERVKQERPTTAQSMHSDKSRTRSSSSSQTPSCPPPDVPLPPVPGPNSSAPTSHRGHAMRSCNSLTSREKDHFLVAHQPPAHHSMGSVLPRSTTCPQLSSSDGYAL